MIEAEREGGREGGRTKDRPATPDDREARHKKPERDRQADRDRVRQRIGTLSCNEFDFCVEQSPSGWDVVL